MPAVVVTGGSAGIGLEIARRFHAEGDTVLLVARDAARLSAAVAEIAAGGAGRVYMLVLDVTGPSAAAELDAALAANGLYLDVLVHSAGTGLSGRFDEHGEHEIAGLIALNISAPTRLTRHALAGMKARRRGGILAVASLGGYVPGPNQAAYYASKAYVASLTEALAEELAGSGVRATVLAPGPVATGFHAAMDAERSLYRWVLPAMSARRVAAAAVFGFRLGRCVVVPGLFYTGLAAAVAVLPHWLTVPVVGLILEPWRGNKRG